MMYVIHCNCDRGIYFVKKRHIAHFSCRRKNYINDLYFNTFDIFYQHSYHTFFKELRKSEFLELETAKILDLPSWMNRNVYNWWRIQLVQEMTHIKSLKSTLKWFALFCWKPKLLQNTNVEIIWLAPNFIWLGWDFYAE